MNRSRKTSLLTSSLFSMILTSGIAQANSEVELVNASLNALYDYQQLLSGAQVDGSQLLAEKREEHFLAHSNILSATKQTERINRSNCNHKKKNALYELTAIFNDKLHLFLASFGEQPTYTAAKNNQSTNRASVHNIKS